MLLRVAFCALAITGTAVAIEDGFVCTPYQNNEPADGTIYCAFFNTASLKWETYTSLFSNGVAKRFCKDVEFADDTIVYYNDYKFCAWDGVYRSEWTTAVTYNIGTEPDPYYLEMDIECPMVPDPEEED